ncbi:hypothetical protein COCNU_15G004560 [Cocos nucifera]|uniref:Protein transport protein Sec24-like CEF n=1 Tax=Cocos nucifera TaxID=13894 RepID=A0A8K0NDH2_COCNU|nr:hypothetical protein COCNU_15G004560 [Cocos nucifera]
MGPPSSRPLGGPPSSQPFVGPPSSQPFGGPRSSQPFPVPPASQSFAGPPASQSFAGPPASQTFAGLPAAQPLSGFPAAQPLSGLPASQPFSGLPASRPFSGLPASQPFSGLPASRPFSGLPASQPFSGLPASRPFSGLPASQPFSGPPASQPYMAPPTPFPGPPTSSSPFGTPSWQSPAQQGVPPMPGTMQAPPRMFGMPPHTPGQTMAPVPPVMGHFPLAGHQVSTPSKIDPNQIPRPVPSTSVVPFETRQGNQANIPPVRDPMPAVFFFIIDVTMNAIQTGATAAACTAISQALADLPAGFLAMKPTGGKLLVFQSGKPHILPSVGIGSLSSREAEGRTNISSGDKEAHKLLQPADKTLKTMAIEFAEYQVCVDIFLTTQTFVDIASISAVPRTTGGQVYYYYPFSALSDTAKLYNDLRWNISRPQGFEAVMRVRCSQGLQVQEYSGNFCKRIPTDIDLPAVVMHSSNRNGFSDMAFVLCSKKACLTQIDCDKTIMVTFKHDDKFQEGSECAFQCALLYTTVYGQRRIRIINISLPCTSMLSNLFRSADLDTQFACFLKQAANGIPTSPLSQVRDQITNLCINILHSYRKYCATVSSSGQLILPEALKLLPLYTLALVKSIGLQNDGRLDDRSYWVSHVASLPISLAVPLVYPRMISIHDLVSKEDDGSLLSATIPLSSEHVNDDGIYLMENGFVNSLFIFFHLETAWTAKLVLQQFDNDLSKKLNDVVNEIRRQRCSYLRTFGAVFDYAEKEIHQLVLQQFDNGLSKKLNDVVNEIRRQRCSYLRCSMFASTSLVYDLSELSEPKAIKQDKAIPSVQYFNFFPASGYGSFQH